MAAVEPEKKVKGVKIMLYDDYKFYRDNMDSSHNKIAKGSFFEKVGVETIWDHDTYWIDRERSPYRAKYQKRTKNYQTFEFVADEHGIRFNRVLGTYIDDITLALACKIAIELTAEYQKYAIRG